jgi:O-succinylbenzoic acid--CoA ligase
VGLSVFAAAAEAPDRLALLADDLALSWAGLAQRVARRVEGLRARSLDGPGPVALTAANDVETFITIHALIALGTPALLLHPRLTDGERRALLEAAGREDRVVTGAPGAPTHGPAPAPPPADERPLAIIHTSGTSGSAKGVVLSRRAFAASAEASAANLGWEDDDRWLLPLPLAHVGGLSILTRCLLARRAVILEADADPERVLASIRRHRASLVSLVPTVLARILDRDPAEAPPDSLRAVLLGGAAASPALLRRAADRGWPVLTTYGLSEACSQVTTQRRGTVNRGEAGSGPPLPGVELRIAEDDAIQVRGPTLFSGYLPDDGDPFLPGGWFPTGDRGRLDDAGNLHVVGRRTDRIVTGGENVDPVEVERALESLPGVRAACVFGVPDEEWGEVVCAAVVPEAPDVGVNALSPAIQGLREGLAPFKLPRRIAMVEALATNATGKVDRRETARIAEPRLRPI